MFESSFSYASATPVPPSLSTETALKILHDFETVIRFSPDCRGCKQIPPPVKNGYTNGTSNSKPVQPIQYWEVEDDLPFIPKRLWTGGVKYAASFSPVEDGCDITIHAPAGFTSTNHWRILRETAPLNEESIPEDRKALPPKLERKGTRDMLHADGEGAGWYVQIVSDAKCSKTYASFVKGFLRNSHAQLQRAFVERLQATPQERKRRPTVGRRRSTHN
ncbi:hypothetical protein LTR37_021079 [Vermiconidia calcicola]|uniref:Uncharacterized protein n=1 Tax=Vermiconidia calcicola TaxID=1690605 RepID=A0ACC3MBF5_9PEZI|nr:hypothetical protein LTR37_021079 [Vermiconidia calcicola]